MSHVQEGLIAPRQKIEFSLCRNWKSVLLRPAKAYQNANPKNKSFTPKQMLLPLNAAGSFLGRVPVALSRFIILSAFGAVTIWLFSPSKSKHPFPSGRNLLEAGSAVPFTSVQADEVMREPDSVTGQQENGAFAPDPPPADSPAEKSDRSQKESVKVAGSTPRNSQNSSRRHVSAKGGRAALGDSRYKTLFEREVADFKVRLISLWRRSGLSGTNHHKRSSSSD